MYIQPLHFFSDVCNNYKKIFNSGTEKISFGLSFGTINLNKRDITEKHFDYIYFFFFVTFGI